METKSIVLSPYGDMLVIYKLRKLIKEMCGYEPTLKTASFLQEKIIVGKPQSFETFPAGVTAEINVFEADKVTNPIVGFQEEVLNSLHEFPEVKNIVSMVDVRASLVWPTCYAPKLADFRLSVGPNPVKVKGIFLYASQASGAKNNIHSVRFNIGDLVVEIINPKKFIVDSKNKLVEVSEMEPFTPLEILDLFNRNIVYSKFERKVRVRMPLLKKQSKFVNHLVGVGCNVLPLGYPNVEICASETAVSLCIDETSVVTSTENAIGINGSVEDFTPEGGVIIKISVKSAPPFVLAYIPPEEFEKV